jgi:predicted dehydrogenase
MQRRQFLTRVGQASAVASATAFASSTRGAGPDGANDRVRVGWIGCGGRGRFVARHLRNVHGVQFVAACDVYERNLAGAKEWIGEGCRTYHDFRQLLDQTDMDAVLVATPDHWHAIPAVLACQAGKDVYVEKPLGHNIAEGRAMVRAAREHKRVVQAGTQQRSAAHFAAMREIVQSGRLGPVHFVRIWNYRNMTPGGIGRKPDSDPPEGLDWDFYLGPAPLVPFNRNRFLGSYRYFYDYSGGIITDWGTHRFDSMLQVMGDELALTSVTACGGRFELDDGGDVPDVQQVTYEFPGFVLSYEASAINAHGMGGRTPGRAYYRADGKDDRPNGLAFYGTNGTIFADRLGFEIYPELKPGRSTLRRPADEITPDFFRTERQEGSSPDSTFLHVTNFIDCVRSRNRPAADVEIGHQASNVAHLGNIAYHVGRKLQWNAKTEHFTDDDGANRLLSREARQPWDLV